MYQIIEPDQRPQNALYLNLYKLHHAPQVKTLNTCTVHDVVATALLYDTTPVTAHLHLTRHPTQRARRYEELSLRSFDPCSTSTSGVHLSLPPPQHLLPPCLPPHSPRLLLHAHRLPHYHWAVHVGVRPRDSNLVARSARR